MHIALVGAGAIGLGAHLPALLRSPTVSGVVVADIDDAALARASQMGSRIEVSSDVVGVLSSSEIDAAVIATPSWVTPGLVRVALGHGRYVLVEKPIAPSIEEGRRMVDLPGVYDRLQIGFTYRHHPAIERLRELIAEEAFGRPLMIQISLCDERADPVGDPVGFRRRLESLRHAPPMVSDGIHACDRLNWLLGVAPQSIQGWSLRSEETFASPNVNGAVLSYADGTLVRLEVVWLYPFLPPSQTVITGPTGRAILDSTSFELKVDTTSRRESVKEARSKTEVCFDKQLEVFLDCCRQGEIPNPGIGEALAALELCQRIAVVAGATRGGDS